MKIKFSFVYEPKDFDSFNEAKDVIKKKSRKQFENDFIDEMKNILNIYFENNTLSEMKAKIIERKDNE